MSVTSIRTAAARPTPACLSSSDESVPKRAKTQTMTAAAAVTTPAVVAIDALTCGGSGDGAPARYDTEVLTWR